MFNPGCASKTLDVDDIIQCTICTFMCIVHLGNINCMLVSIKSDFNIP